ncbi:MAG TPA: hypothetical protein DCR14_00375 [Acidimicrobiaceae bacterium]|nr:hypothetical protein [Acidimicrobiaceae bacterium]
MTAFNGWAAMAYGTGPTQVLLLGYGSGATASTDAFEAFVNNFEPIPGVQLLLLPDPNGDSVISASHVNALRTSGVEHVVWFDGNENVVGASGDAWFYLGLDIDFVGRVGPTPPEVGSLPQQLSNWLLPLTPTP